MNAIRRLLITLIVAAPLAAQCAWPDKPVKVVVGFPAGGPSDIVARTYAERAGQALKQPFITENKPGANTVIAAESVATAKPDGYTLLVAATNHTQIPALYSDRVRFDAAKSFRAVCTLASSPTVLVVGPSLAVKNTAEFLAALRAKPGKYTYASTGIGASVHFFTEDFLKITKTSMVHVPYKGAAPAVTDLLGGQVDAYFASVGSVLPHIKAGKLRAIAVATAKRSALLPEVPTFDESGVKGYYADSWYGLLAPAGTPEPVLKLLEREAIEFGKAASVREKLNSAGLEPRTVCGDAFTTQIAGEIALYTKIAKELDLKVD